MAKLKVFVSSTYYDLKHIRASLEAFLDNMGYEPILFESGDITFHTDKSLDESCYKEINNADILILIIGGRYGSPDSTSSDPNPKEGITNKMYDEYTSVTKKEYETANKRGIPIFFFVESKVYGEYDTYRSNRDNENINYAHVSSVNVFKFIDEIYELKVGNFVKPFEKFEDISEWLKMQWSGMFADYIKQSNSNIELKKMSDRIDELGAITGTLKKYTEALMEKIQPENFKKIIEIENLKIISKTVTESKLVKHLINEFHVKNDFILIVESLEKSNNYNEFILHLGLDINEPSINEFTQRFDPMIEADFIDLKESFEKYKKNKQ